ncbi:MAG: ankyrin repeat domain-containing protein, partial [Deltaproteobacteria bacterium]
VQDNNGDAPLILASRNGHIDIVKLLAEYKADLNVQDKFGNTPLMNACMRMHTGIASFLIERGADLTITNKENKTALDIAAKMRLESVVNNMKRRDQRR